MEMSHTIGQSTNANSAKGQQMAHKSNQQINVNISIPCAKQHCYQLGCNLSHFGFTFTQKILSRFITAT